MRCDNMKVRISKKRIGRLLLSAHSIPEFKLDHDTPSRPFVRWFHSESVKFRSSVGFSIGACGCAARLIRKKFA